MIGICVHCVSHDEGFEDIVFVMMRELSTVCPSEGGGYNVFVMMRKVDTR